MTVSREEIEHIAHLASLEVDEDAIAELTQQIGDILQFVSQLDAVDSAPQPAPEDTAPPPAPLRGDVVDPIPMSRSPGEMAPEFADGFYLVPKVAGLGEDE
jgi:aspartyl-tRNA(Asn)/glutamyl-tRNA(Gln) amidotransferase subunit C